MILDLGCGGKLPRLCRCIKTGGLINGVLNVQFAQGLAKGKGRIHGVEASEAMIAVVREN